MLVVFFDDDYNITKTHLLSSATTLAMSPYEFLIQERGPDDSYAVAINLKTALRDRNLYHYHISDDGEITRLLDYQQSEE